MMEDFGGRAAWEPLVKHLEEIGETARKRAKALLVISAHWEEPVPTVHFGSSPGMLYDYYGFPDHTYHLSWPAPGAPDVARRVDELLRGAGFKLVCTGCFPADIHPCLASDFPLPVTSTPRSKRWNFSRALSLSLRSWGHGKLPIKVSSRIWKYSLTVLAGTEHSRAMFVYSFIWPLPSPASASAHSIPAGQSDTETG